MMTHKGAPYIISPVFNPENTAISSVTAFKYSLHNNVPCKLRSSRKFTARQFQSSAHNI